MLAGIILVNVTDGQGQNQRVKMDVFEFGPLRVTVSNPRGVFIASDNLKQRIATMTVEDAKAANREAWRLRKQYERIMNRNRNATLSPGVYDSVSGPHTITESICKLTYRRMMA